jgi:hypothetical protein
MTYLMEFSGEAAGSLTTRRFAGDAIVVTNSAGSIGLARWIYESPPAAFSSDLVPPHRAVAVIPPSDQFVCL